MTVCLRSAAGQRMARDQASRKALAPKPASSKPPSTTRPSKGPKTLRPIHANAGIDADYRRRLKKLIQWMVDSCNYWLLASYRKNEPEVAQDELPADALRREIRKLGRRWQRQFDRAAPQLAEYFQQAVKSRSDAVLMKILRDAGISVKFRNTAATRDVIAAGFHENVALIKSIPEKFLTDVEGHVMRAVQQGRDLSTLADELQRTYGMTKRRAAFISRDQVNKATANIARARQLELGITEAVWVHSGGGKEPRPNHVKFGREKSRYDVKKGMWDPDANGKGKGAWIFPGTLPNCRCVSKPIIPGF